MNAFDELTKKGLPNFELDQTAMDQHLQMLRSLPAQDLNPEPQRKPRPRRLIAGAIAAILIGAAGAGTATAFGFFSEKPTDRSVARCFATAELDRDDNFQFMTIAQPPGQPLVDTAAEAVELCRYTWEVGMIGTEEPMSRLFNEEEAKKYHPVPPLVACVLETGDVGVFPGPETVCSDLNLPNADLS